MRGRDWREARLADEERIRADLVASGAEEAAVGELFPSPDGTIYLLHFDRPLAHARHYIGWTEDLERRLRKHERGGGAAIVTAALEEGIGIVLAATFTGTKRDEGKLKDRGGARRICPVCRGGAPIRVVAQPTSSGLPTLERLDEEMESGYARAAAEAP